MLPVVPSEQYVRAMRSLKINKVHPGTSASFKIFDVDLVLKQIQLKSADCAQEL